MASDRINQEDELSKGKEDSVVLPKMSKKEKRHALKEALKGASR